MSKPRLPSADRRRLVRVAAYYVVLGVVVAAALRWIPGAREMLTGAQLASLAQADLFARGGGSPPPVTPGSGGVLGAVSMISALAIMVPVTWVYMISRRYRGFDESVVQTLLILPVAVTGIVVIVQHSVALAFSLAGIVAGVRFRTTLDDTNDAVYVFLAIGVGLAAGVQQFGLALVLSIFFNSVVLVLWAARFGNVYAAAEAGELSLGDALAGPDSGPAARVVGDSRLLDAAAPADIADVLERAARMERHLAGERVRKKSKRANTLLIVRAPKAGPAQDRVEEELAGLASRWHLVEILPVADGGVALEYLARFETPAAEGELLDRLRQAGDVVAAAEMRTLAGIWKSR